MQRKFKKQLLNVATSPYRAAGFFDYRWARGKLFGDPIFTALLEHRVFSDGARVLDLGCGRGLLAAWMLAAEEVASTGGWMASMDPPAGLSFQGVELIAPEAERGNRALRAQYGERVALTGGDMRQCEFDEVDAVAMLDVLHYISHAEQELLLERIRAALPKDGLFVTRVGDAESGWRFQFSQLIDRCMAMLQGHRSPPTWCRGLAAWVQTMESKGFSVRVLPMSDGTLFANFMLICRVK